jgi:hypothetical protein
MAQLAWMLNIAARQYILPERSRVREIEISQIVSERQQFGRTAGGREAC